MSSNYLPKKYRQYLGLGAEIAATLAVPILLGYLLDVYFQSSPWGLLGGAVTGIVFFFFSVFRIARNLEKNGD